MGGRDWTCDVAMAVWVVGRFGGDVSSVTTGQGGWMRLESDIFGAAGGCAMQLLPRVGGKGAKLMTQRRAHGRLFLSVSRPAIILQRSVRYCLSLSIVRIKLRSQCVHLRTYSLVLETNESGGHNTHSGSVATKTITAHWTAV